MARLVIREDVYDELMKAYGHKDMSKLTKKQITDKNGHTKNVWVRTGEEPEAQRTGRSNIETEPSSSGRNPLADKLKTGDNVKFAYGGNTLSGEIIARGMKGVQVRDGDGNVYKVDYEKIIGTTAERNFYPEKTLAPSTDKKQIPAKVFSAKEYKKYSDDPEINSSPEGIRKGFERALAQVPKIKAEVAEKFIKRVYADIDKANKATETVKKYRVSGEGLNAVYTKERFEIHEKIIDKILSPENIRKATPKNGEKPYFMILGGRGGSGKSTFDKEKNPDSGVYKESECIHVDPDAIKEMLAEESGEGWEGWKARMYHEESSDVSKIVMNKAEEMGLNIVMDITMSNADVQIAELKQASKLGYKTGAYYMHVPKQESFCRAMGRYLENPKTKEPDYTGRLVPPDVLLNMTDNEDNFDKVKDFADDWSFYDNFVPFKDKNGKKNNAIKIAQKGE